MRILVAPDSFKGTLSAAEAARAMARGACEALRASGGRCEIDLCPIADGGEGTLDAIAAAVRARRHGVDVEGPLGEPARVEWGSWTGASGERFALVETSAGAGWRHVPPDRRDPERTTTYGLGRMIGAACAPGADVLCVALGGSATVDGGTGVAQALGARFELDPPLGPGERMRGGRLGDIRRIEPSIGVGGACPRVVALCDVDNPLTGPRGAAPVFGPQKGATAAQVERLDAGLANLAAYAREAGLAADPEAPGSGAAGGLGYGLAAFLGAEIRSGAEFVLDAVGFEARVRGADLVLTGEGRLDAQTIGGKAVWRVARAAAAVGVPSWRSWAGRSRGSRGGWRGRGPR